SPALTLIATIVASAIDSPSCGMVIGICGIGESVSHSERSAAESRNPVAQRSVMLRGPSTPLRFAQDDGNSFLKNLAHFGRDRLCVRPVLAPKIRMVRNRGVFRVEARRSGIEQVKALRRDARDHFGGHAAPRERFADAKQ